MKRRVVSDELREKLESGGRKARSMSPMSASEAMAGRPNKKQEAELQERINQIVTRALQQQSSGNGVDVIRGDHWIRLNGLRASRVG